MKTIKIKLLRGLNTVSPQGNSDWIDLRAAEETLKGRNRGGIGSTGRV